MIRSIETETYAENPPLFREYATAPPDIRLLMDNQFRNVKTHARLLSKATWYEWRMKLLDGLKEGLHRHVDEMKADGDLLTKYETLLDGLVTSLVEKQSALQEEATNLQQLADEMESCDQDELRNAREKLSSLDDEIELKRKQLQELQGQVQEKTSSIESAAELKAEFLAQIQEAERVKEECHGWSAKEISELKGKIPRSRDDHVCSKITHNLDRIRSKARAPDRLVHRISHLFRLTRRPVVDHVLPGAATTRLPPGNLCY